MRLGISTKAVSSSLVISFDSVIINRALINYAAIFLFSYLFIHIHVKWLANLIV